MKTDKKSSLPRAPRGLGWALFLMAAVVFNLYSTESVTLTTSYPSPSGIYMRLMSTGDTVLARDGGRVGIGTPNPGYKVDVVGVTRVNAAGRVYLGGGAAAGQRGLELFESGGNTFEVRAHNPGVAWMNLVLNSQGGNVGVGTAAPGAKLDVQGGAIRAGGGLILPAGAPANPVPGQIWIQ